MKDLEIRGAGNLLGGEQSGHIEGVGFDLYVRMVGEAVADFRGEVEEEAADVTIELPVDAHLPHDYIAHERLRLEAYRKIAGGGRRRRRSTRSAPSSSTATARCREPVDNLFEVAEFRQHVRAAGLTRRHRAGQVRAVRARRPARVRAAAAQAALPGLGAQAGDPHGPRAVPDDGAGRRQAAAGPRGPRLGAAAHRRGRARATSRRPPRRHAAERARPRARQEARGPRRRHGRGRYDDPDRRATTREVRRWRCSGVRVCDRRACWSRWRRRPVWPGAPGSPARRPWSTAGDRRVGRRSAALTELGP